jgi:hypothetical protein
MTPKKKTVFIIGIEFHFSREPRIIQEIYALRGHYRLVGVGRGSHPDMDEFLDITKDLSALDMFLDKILRYLKYFFPFLLRFRHRKVLRWIDEIQPDCISAHHLESAILAYVKTDKMIFNSHEFIPKQNDGILIWKYTKGWMIKTTLPKALRHTAIMYVEGEAAKEAYLDYYKSIPETVVIPNATKAWPELKPSPVDPGHIKIVHHGNATVGRGLETFVDVARKLGPGYSMHFYLVQSAIFPKYYQQLKDYAKDVPTVFFYDAVPYDDIVPTVNPYDIGLCLFKSTSYHTKYTMVPNKFWEYNAARVTPIIWKESGIARICEKYNFGIIADEPTVECIVDVIRRQTVEGLMRDKQRMDEIHNEFIAEKTIYPVMLDCVKRTIEKS